MTTVFISGSRHIHYLNPQVRERLQKVLDRHFSIVVGDAGGVDKAVQAFLSEPRYEDITVYCSGRSCRNNLGNWSVRHVAVDPDLRGRDFYTQKDKAMVTRADYGFVIWDGKSPGSFSNIMELLKENKKSLVYFSPRQAFRSISKLEDAKRLLGECDADALDNIGHKIRLSSTPRTIKDYLQGTLSLSP